MFAPAYKTQTSGDAFLSRALKPEIDIAESPFKTVDHGGSGPLAGARASADSAAPRNAQAPARLELITAAVLSSATDALAYGEALETFCIDVQQAPVRFKSSTALVEMGALAAICPTNREPVIKYN